jgi:hypothetical protein
LTRFGARVLVTSGETSESFSSGSGSGGGGGGGMGSGLASGFWRLAVWEGAACDWRSKKWRMPNLAGCDGCEGGGGFFDAAAAAARFRGAMAARVEDWRREAGFGGRRWNGEGKEELGKIRRGRRWEEKQDWRCRPPPGG